MYPKFLVHCSVVNHLAYAGNELQRARFSRTSVTLSLWALWAVKAHSCAVRSRKSSRRHRGVGRTRRFGFQLVCGNPLVGARGQGVHSEGARRLALAA